MKIKGLEKEGIVTTCQPIEGNLGDQWTLWIEHILATFPVPKRLANDTRTSWIWGPRRNYTGSHLALGGQVKPHGAGFNAAGLLAGIALSIQICLAFQYEKQ